MPPRCPISACPSTRIQCRGSFTRKDGRSVRRYQCQSCKKFYSDQTGTPTFLLRRLDLLKTLRDRLMCSASQRRCALMLKTTPNTIARFVTAIAKIDTAWQQRYLKRLGRVETIVFDEMMAYEHTRWKPLSLPIAVCEGTQAILGIAVARIPPSGLAAAKALAKYGPRKDESSPVRLAFLRSLVPTCGALGVVKSDMHQAYGAEVRQAFPKRIHQVFRSRKGCVVGYGELKQVGFDPIFALNHACAMVRDSVATLKRRTWTTPKIPERLAMLAAIYVRFHNEVLLPARKGPIARSRPLPPPE